MDMGHDQKISAEMVVAYAHCPRKAFLLMCTDENGTTHDYVHILEHRRMTNRDKHIHALKQSSSLVTAYDVNSRDSGAEVVTGSYLIYEGLEAYCDILTRAKDNQPSGTHTYEPTIVVGTYSISNEQRLELSFVGHVLGKLQGHVPSLGKIVGMDSKVHKIDLEGMYPPLRTFIDTLRKWILELSSEPPPVILNEHCPYCPFQASCKAIAEKNDDISLLDRASPKIIQQYHSKGIFTVRQLSYLFKPRKNRRRLQKKQIAHRLELQALAIRTNKIYLQETPAISRNQIELFLDIEGIPDQNFYYLIGLLVCREGSISSHSFWADTSNDEERIWAHFLETVNQHPEAPIYHYGSYEPRAIAKLASRYQSEYEQIKVRLVNINEHIYGKIYFPVRSNGLKDITKFMGAQWTSPDASGLQSVAWRYLWEETGDTTYKQALTTYNVEDCKALKLLTDEISRISTVANSEPTIDFIDHPKQYSTQTGEEIHNEFKNILRSAHANYDKNKINIRTNRISEHNGINKRGGKKGHRGYKRIVPRARKVILVPQRLSCPRCADAPLRASKKTAETTVIDTIFTKDGCRKTITKYIWILGYCRTCTEYYSPEEMRKKGMAQVFGHGLQAWVIYQRLVLRLSYNSIAQALEDQFRETLSHATIVNFINRFASYYAETEELIIKQVLQSPFVHVDETKISIEGDNQYVWVFTDGKHVFFKLTETREANIVHEILAEYKGILISDFYGGYDSVSCRQQKCLVHLIRDLNEDLWKAPLDDEFGLFVAEVRNLLVPIIESVDKYGLKERHLRKFTRHVARFYDNFIVGKEYWSDLTNKYQKRFIRYRQSLFTFLEHDAIPWNNKMAERAIRHLAIQRKISGSFYESVAPRYLLLLAITQTCRFQGKSMLEFLMSGEKDIDTFRGARRIRRTIPVDSSANHID